MVRVLSDSAAMVSAVAADYFPRDRYAVEAIPGAEAPQVQWWDQKFEQRRAGTRKQKMRSVGSMRPTNLNPLKSSSNLAREQRIKCQEHREIPTVPRPLRPPCDLGLAMTLAKLAESNLPGVATVQELVRKSFETAYESVVKAAKAHEVLCEKTEQMMKTGSREAAKKARKATRDVLLWLWFGLTCWIYNQAESEFFQSYGREIESQLINSVVQIRQRLMQDLMQRPAFKKLQAHLQRRAATHSLTAELEGLLSRCHWIYDSLGGPNKPELQAFRVPQDDAKSSQEMALEEEKEREEEAAFANKVGELQGQRIADSVIGFLAIEDEEDDVKSVLGMDDYDNDDGNDTDNDDEDDNDWLAKTVAESFASEFHHFHPDLGGSENNTSWL